MGLISKLDHHNDLINRMANTVDTNFAKALADGRLSGQDLRNAVMACTGCEGGAQCPDWLAEHADGAEDTPEYCRNRDLLMRLRD